MDANTIPLTLELDEVIQVLKGMEAAQLQVAIQPQNRSMKAAIFTDAQALGQAATLLKEFDTTQRQLFKDLNEVEQILGQGLGSYPWYKDDQANFPGATEADGVCVGEHIPATLAHEAMNKLKQARDDLDAMFMLEEALDPGYCPTCGSCGDDGCCGELLKQECATAEDCVYGEGPKLSGSLRLARYIKRQNDRLAEAYDTKRAMLRLMKLWVDQKDHDGLFEETQKLIASEEAKMRKWKMKEPQDETVELA